VAGGSILYPLDSAPRRSKISPAMQARLLALPEADDANRIAVQLELAGRLGVTLAELSLLTDIAPKALEKQLQAMSGRGLAFCWDKDAKSWIAAPALDVLSSKALEAVEAFHKKNPLQPGMAKGVVLAGMGRDVPPKLAHHVLEKLLRGGKLAADGETLRLPGHTVSLANDQQALKDALLAAHRKDILVPPNHTELFSELGITSKQAQPIFKLLVAEGSLVKIKEDLYFLGEVMEELRARVRTWFETHDEISPGDFRDITTISRKNGVALLEHFDKEQITMRVGDKRVLRGRRP
jgi:selenocysteine-specific elongation factor